MISLELCQEQYPKPIVKFGKKNLQTLLGDSYIQCLPSLLKTQSVLETDFLWWKGHSPHIKRVSLLLRAQEHLPAIREKGVAWKLPYDRKEDTEMGCRLYPQSIIATWTTHRERGMWPCCDFWVRLPLKMKRKPPDFSNGSTCTSMRAETYR